MTPAVEIVGCNTSVASESLPLGAVMDGELIIRSFLKDVTVKTANDGLTFVWNSRVPGIVRPYLMTNTGVGTDNIPQTVTPIVLLSEYVMETPEKTKSRLILSPVDGRKNVYHRVGWFDGYNDKGALGEIGWEKETVKVVQRWIKRLRLQEALDTLDELVCLRVLFDSNIHQYHACSRLLDPMRVLLFGNSSPILFNNVTRIIIS